MEAWRQHQAQSVASLAGHQLIYQEPLRLHPKHCLQWPWPQRFHSQLQTLPQCSSRPCLRQVCSQIRVLQRKVQLACQLMLWSAPCRRKRLYQRPLLCHLSWRRQGLGQIFAPFPMFLRRALSWRQPMLPGASLGTGALSRHPGHSPRLLQHPHLRFRAHQQIPTQTPLQTAQQG